MATTSTFKHINKGISLAGFTPELVQGTPNHSLTADGVTTASSGTSISFKIDSGATQNNNCATIPANYFQGLQVYFSASTTTSALQGKVYDISASTAVDGNNEVQLTVNTMAATPATTETFTVFAPLPADSMDLSPETEELLRDFHRQTLDKPASIRGISKVSGSFNVEIPGLITTLDSSNTPTKDRWSVLLGQIFTRTVDQGSTMVSATSTTVTVTTSHGSRFTEKISYIMVSNQVRRVESISTDTLTVDRAWTTTPTGTPEVYNCETYEPVDTEHGTFTLHFIEDDRLIEARGCLCSIKFGASFSEAVKATVEFDGEWDTTQMTDAASLSGYQANIDPIPFVNTAGMYFNSTDLSCNMAEFDLGHSRDAIRDTEAGQRFFTRERDSVIAVKFRDQVKTPKTTWEKEGTKAFMVAAFGNEAGGCVGAGGQAQVKETIGLDEENGTGYYDAQFRLYDDHDAATATRPQVFRF